MGSSTHAATSLLALNNRLLNKKETMSNSPQYLTKELLSTGSYMRILGFKS